MLGRRGPAQAAFTPKEIRELGALSGVTLVVDPTDLVGLDPADADGEDARRVLEALHEVAGRTPDPGDRVIALRFLTSPVALNGGDRVASVSVVRNRLVADTKGATRAVATDETAMLDAGLVLRAVGYRGRALEGLPFDGERGVIPNELGRVVDPQSGALLVGTYVAGWIKRGPQGVIGTNKQDAGETVDAILEDLDEGRLTLSDRTETPTVSVLTKRRARWVDWAGWQAIDHAEQAAGAAAGRPRVKITDREQLFREATAPEGHRAHTN
jgi:ferredoxin--NADP+ reductase